MPLIARVCHDNRVSTTSEAMRSGSPRQTSKGLDFSTKKRWSPFQDNQRFLKGRVGVEPTRDGFAIRCLSHLATTPVSTIQIVNEAVCGNFNVHSASPIYTESIG